MYSCGNILSRNYLLYIFEVYVLQMYIFEFQLNSFAFSIILRDPFMMSPSPLMYGEGELFSKKNFFLGTNFVGKIYSRIALHVGTNDQNIPAAEEFFKMYFPVI